MQEETFSGVVESGGKQASELGFPTANIPLSGECSGIYAARAIVEGEQHSAVAYADRKRRILEVHLLDTQAELYGKMLAVTLLEKLREDMSFTDEEVARVQIERDVEAARAYFAKMR